MSKGAFVVTEDNGTIGYSLIAPSGKAPKDQGDLLRLVGEVEVTLKILFPKQGEKFRAYFTRLLDAAQAGLVGNNPPTALCIASVEQMKTEIALREGRSIKTQYLVELGIIALVSAILAIAGAWLSTKLEPKMTPYLYVWLGSMVGLWVSYAIRRTITSYDELVSMDRRTTEAVIRVIYVGLVSVVLALFLSTEVVQFSIGDFQLKEFKTSREIAALLGVLAGFSEQTLPTKLLDAGKKAFD